MKLLQAIAIETLHNDHHLYPPDAERREAHQLLIEAGKRILHMRQTLPHVVQPLLKGEERG